MEVALGQALAVGRQLLHMQFAINFSNGLCMPTSQLWIVYHLEVFFFKSWFPLMPLMPSISLHNNCIQEILHGHDNVWYRILLSQKTVSPVRVLLKCQWNEIFYYLIRKSFQNDKEWRLFYCDSTLGCWVIQDFDLCKLDDLWHHRLVTKWCKITKNWISLTTFSV